MPTFRAMNTEVTVIVPGCDSEGEHVRAVTSVFAANERRFSRFRADSELAALQRAPGEHVVSAALFAALERARDYHERTDGLFDPCVGASLIALGYDRSFAHGALDRGAVCPPNPGATFADVALDPELRRVTLPPGALLDLGGMIKGHTVDEAALVLPEPSLVDAGGDARLRGAGLEGEGYLVDVEDPMDCARTMLTLRVRDRAVATSAPNRRRWRTGDEVRHHLIDPRTGRSSNTDLAQVTVLASSAELAEVLAKAAFLLGERGAIALLRREADVAAVLVDTDGRMVTFGDLEVDDA